MQGWIEDGTIIFSDDQTRIIKKTFLKDQAGIVPSNIWWDVDDTGHNRNAKYELLKIFSGLHSSEVFKTPKPTKFVEKILQMFNGESLMVLDSFAGSGTTAHAVLNMNKADGGHRKFILVEMMDYAESITAERVRRVIRGYGEGKNAVDGTGGSFSYYELGEPLLHRRKPERSRCPRKNPGVHLVHGDQDALHARRRDNPYYLGQHNDTGYYFYYEPQRITVLDYDFLATVTEKAGGTVIYADRCSIDDSKLSQMGDCFQENSPRHQPLVRRRHTWN